MDVRVRNLWLIKTFSLDGGKKKILKGKNKVLENFPVRYECLYCDWLDGNNNDNNDNRKLLLHTIIPHSLPLVVVSVKVVLLPCNSIKP